jgi:polysaccharide export outer membrane protein
MELSRPIKTRAHQFSVIKKSVLLTWVIFTVLLGICPYKQAQTTTQDNKQRENSGYKIGIGDVLKILVFKQDILSQDNLRVGNEGAIRMPLLDDAIPALCLTEAELSADIANRYKKYLLNPQVYVTVKEINSNPVAVVGAVNAPGRFQLQRPMRLLELLTYVNGPALNAGQNVQILRDSNKIRCDQKITNPLENSSADTLPKQEIIFLTLAEVLKGTEKANPYIESGDIILVTEAEIKQAYIIGNVKTPSVITLKEPVPLSRAIAIAGGFAPGAQIDKIKISRQATDSLAKTEILVNLKENKKNPQPQEDILLQPNDIIEVPGPKRNVVLDIFKSVIPTVTRLPVLIP